MCIKRGYRMNKLNSERLVLNLSPYHKNLLRKQAKANSLSMNAYVMFLLMVEEKKQQEKEDKPKQNDK